MTFFVQTRGRERSEDYRFLGVGPAQAWWATRYGNRTAFERPTVFVERDAAGVRAYLGAVPSCRQDPAGATNRVTIVAEGDRLADDERRLLLALIGAWVDDIGTGGRQVADALDKAFDEQAVAQLYGDGEARAEEARSRLLDAARTLGAPDTTAATGDTASWIAPIRSEVGRAEFIRRADELLSGRRTGSAVLVNLTDDAADFTAEARTGVAVLVHGPAGVADERPVEIVSPREERVTPGKVPTRLRGGSSPDGTRPRRLLVMIAAVALLVGAAVAVVIGARSGSTPNPAQDPQPPPTPTPAVIAPLPPAGPATTSSRTTPAPTSGSTG